MTVTATTPDYFRLAAHQLGILPVPEETADPELTAHNVTAMRWHVFQRQCMEFIEAEGGVDALRCLVEALQSVETSRRALMDRR